MKRKETKKTAFFGESLSAQWPAHPPLCSVLCLFAFVLHVIAKKGWIFPFPHGFALF
jgi:hypothetical protein